MENEIRKATLKDIDRLTELFEAYRIFYKKLPDKESARAFLKARISNGESEIFIALHEDGDMVGFVQLYPLFSSTKMKRLWLLNDLFVDPRFRGRGFSVKLIERSKQLCRETNACRLLLETAKTNYIGNNLYPKTGFTLDEDHNYYSWEYQA